MGLAEQLLTEAIGDLVDARTAMEPLSAIPEDTYRDPARAYNHINSAIVHSQTALSIVTNAQGQAIISWTPADFIFVEPGGAQVLTIRNDQTQGSGNLIVDLTGDEVWLTASPGHLEIPPTQEATSNIAITWGGQNPPPPNATTDAAITLSHNASNIQTPVAIPVEVTTQGAPPPSDPVLETSPSQLNYTYSGQNIVTQQIEVWNSGSGTLNYEAIENPWESWLRIDGASWNSTTPVTGSHTGSNAPHNTHDIGVNFSGFGGNEARSGKIDVSDTPAGSVTKTVNINAFRPGPPPPGGDCGEGSYLCDVDGNNMCGTPSERTGLGNWAGWCVSSQSGTPSGAGNEKGIRRNTVAMKVLNLGNSVTCDVEIKMPQSWFVCSAGGTHFGCWGMSPRRGGPPDYQEYPDGIRMEYSRQCEMGFWVEAYSRQNWDVYPVSARNFYAGQQVFWPDEWTRVKMVASYNPSAGTGSATVTYYPPASRGGGAFPVSNNFEIAPNIIYTLGEIARWGKQPNTQPTGYCWFRNESRYNSQPLRGEGQGTLYGPSGVALSDGDPKTGYQKPSLS